MVQLLISILYKLRVVAFHRNSAGAVFPVVSHIRLCPEMKRKASQDQCPVQTLCLQHYVPFCGQGVCWGVPAIPLLAAPDRAGKWGSVAAPGDLHSLVTEVRLSL
jgi:hypothetical protein